MTTVLLVIGLGQITLAIGSLFLPKMLGWRAELSRLGPLTRRVFWVYAGYILATNLCLGSVTAFAPHLLLDRTPLARIVAGYGCLYWGARVVIQFVWFRGVAPKGVGYALADGAVTMGFVLCTIVYGAITLDLW